MGCTVFHWQEANPDPRQSWDCFPLLQDEEPIRMKAGKDHEDLSSPFLIYSEASPKDSERAED